MERGDIGTQMVNVCCPFFALFSDMILAFIIDLQKHGLLPSLDLFIKNDLIDLLWSHAVVY